MLTTTIGDYPKPDDVPRARGNAFADALDVEIRRLAEAGCPAIQVLALAAHSLP